MRRWKDGPALESWFGVDDGFETRVVDVEISPGGETPLGQVGAKSHVWRSAKVLLSQRVQKTDWCLIQVKATGCCLYLSGGGVTATATVFLIIYVLHPSKQSMRKVSRRHVLWLERSGRPLLHKYCCSTECRQFPASTWLMNPLISSQPLRRVTSLFATLHSITVHHHAAVPPLMNG